MDRVVARLFTVDEAGAETLLVEHGPWSGFETFIEYGLLINRGEGESVDNSGQKRATWRMWDGFARFGDFQSDATPDELKRARARIWDEWPQVLRDDGPIPTMVRDPSDSFGIQPPVVGAANAAIDSWRRTARLIHDDAVKIVAENDRLRKELQELQGSVYNVRLLRRVLPDDDGVVFAVAVTDLPDGFAFDEVPGPHGEVARLTVLVRS